MTCVDIIIDAAQFAIQTTSMHTLGQTTHLSVFRAAVSCDGKDEESGRAGLE